MAKGKNTVPILHLQVLTVYSLLALGADTICSKVYWIGLLHYVLLMECLSRFRGTGILWYRHHWQPISLGKGCMDCRIQLLSIQHGET